MRTKGSTSVRPIATAGTLFALVASMLFLGDGVALSSHGPPHTCESQAITSLSLNATNGNDSLMSPGGVAEVVAAGEGQDRVLLGDRDDYLCGNEGADTELDGGTDDDHINAGAGDDPL